MKWVKQCVIIDKAIKAMQDSEGKQREVWKHQDKKTYCGDTSLVTQSIQIMTSWGGDKAVAVAAGQGLQFWW